MKEDIETRFWAFHAANPQVYAELARLSREAKQHGALKLGIRMLWEVMRWNLTILTTHDDDFKLNDHYTSRYARLLMDQEPDLAQLFELRELRSGPRPKYLGRTAAVVGDVSTG